MYSGIAFLYADQHAHRADMRRREKHKRAHPHKCFVKVSGDLLLSERFIEWLTQLARANTVVVSIGGGTQINAALDEALIVHAKDPKLGRDTSKEGYTIAQRVLESNRSQLLKRLESEGVLIDTVLPIFNLAGNFCHVDGDLMVYAAYWGFDALYAITTLERVGAKQKLFAELPKIHIIGM